MEALLKSHPFNHQLVSAALERFYQMIRKIPTLAGPDEAGVRRAGGLDGLHVEDLHGLGDDGAGVDLAVDPHDEGLVEQDVCVLCRGGGGGNKWVRRNRTSEESRAGGAWPHLGTEARTPAGS